MSFPRTRDVTTDEDLAVEVEALQFQVADLIASTMSDKQVSRSELARRLGVSAAHVTQMLSGERNLTLKSLAEALYVLDCRLETEAVPLREEPQVSPRVLEAHRAPRPFEVDARWLQGWIQACDSKGLVAREEQPAYSVDRRVAVLPHDG